MLTTAQVAKRANISVQSVRNWTTDYAILLSPQAQGDAGARLFSAEDVDTICTIAALRRTGMMPAQIIARIQADTAPPVVDAAPTEPTNSPQTAHNAPQTTTLAQAGPQHAHNALVARLERVERTQETLLRAALLWGVLLGAIGAFALASFVVWLLYLWAG